MARPRGSQNKTTAGRQARVASADQMPLDRIIKAMVIFESMAARHAPQIAGADNPNYSESKFILYVEKMASMAEKAAPYLHNRLASISHRLIPHDLSRLSDAELAALERLVATTAVAELDQVGDQPTTH